MSSQNETRQENRPSIFGESVNQNKRKSGTQILTPDRAGNNNSQARNDRDDMRVSEFEAPLKQQPSAFPVDIDFTAAGVDVEINTGGTIVDFNDSTNNSDVITVKYNSKTAKGIRFRPGKAVDGIPFTKLFLSWSVIAGASGQITIYRDEPDGDVKLT